MIQLHQSDRVMISTWAASASSFLSFPAIFLLPLSFRFLPSLSCFFSCCCLDSGAVVSMFFFSCQIWMQISMAVFRILKKWDFIYSICPFSHYLPLSHFLFPSLCLSSACLSTAISSLHWWVSCRCSLIFWLSFSG